MRWRTVSMVNRCHFPPRFGSRLSWERRGPFVSRFGERSRRHAKNICQPSNSSLPRRATRSRLGPALPLLKKQQAEHTATPAFKPAWWIKYKGSDKPCLKEWENYGRTGGGETVEFYFDESTYATHTVQEGTGAGLPKLWGGPALPARYRIQNPNWRKKVL